jgi:hypothetical protein
MGEVYVRMTLVAISVNVYLPSEFEMRLAMPGLLLETGTLILAERRSRPGISMARETSKISEYSVLKQGH